MGRFRFSNRRSFLNSLFLKAATTATAEKTFLELKIKICADVRISQFFLPTNLLALYIFDK